MAITASNRSWRLPVYSGSRISSEIVWSATFTRGADYDSVPNSEKFAFAIAGSEPVLLLALNGLADFVPARADFATQSIALDRHRAGDQVVDLQVILRREINGLEGFLEVGAGARHGGVRRVKRAIYDLQVLQRCPDALGDLLGKAGHIHTVPIPGWVKVAVDEWKDARTRVTGRYPDHRALPWMQAEAALRGQPSDWHRARRCQVISKRRGYRAPLGDKRVSIAGISIRGPRPPQSDMPTTRSDGMPIQCPPTGPSQSVYQARHQPIAVARSQPINSDWVPV